MAHRPVSDGGKKGGRGTHGHSGPLVLDGFALAAARAPDLAARGKRVAASLGRRPRLVLVAFADGTGSAPFVARKMRACAAAGVDVLPLTLPLGASTSLAVGKLGACLAGERPDAVFLEFPFPDRVDGDALIALVPASTDVDIMTADGVGRFFADPDAPPPLTVSAGLALLDGHAVDIRGRPGVVVGDDTPFTQMFREALARRGARMLPVVSSRSPDMLRAVQEAELVVAAASVPEVMSSTALSPGTVLIDVGYFNAGGRGDVDTSGGIAHLAAIAPVPGGIGPMTVSMLVERVIAFAERTARESRLG